MTRPGVLAVTLPCHCHLPVPGSLASMDLYCGVNQQCSTTVAKRPNLLQPPSAPPPPSHLTSRQHLFPHSSDPEAGGLLFARPSRGRGLWLHPQVISHPRHGTSSTWVTATGSSPASLHPASPLFTAPLSGRPTP